MIILINSCITFYSLIPNTQDWQNICVRNIIQLSLKVAHLQRWLLQPSFQPFILISSFELVYLLLICTLQLAKKTAEILTYITSNTHHHTILLPAVSFWTGKEAIQKSNHKKTRRLVKLQACKRITGVKRTVIKQTNQVGSNDSKNVFHIACQIA